MARRKLLVNKPFQVRFLFFLVIVALAVVIIFYLANVLFFTKFRGIGLSAGLPPDHVFFQFIDQQKKLMSVLFLISSVVAGGAMVFLGLLYSNKIAGPLYRLRLHMQKVAATGSREEVHFRKGDYFTELADGFNEVMRKK